MEAIKIIIVDDEPKARRILSLMLEQHCSEVEVLAVCEDVPSAVIAINKIHPDLVFLDIEMPGYSGFQLFEFFENPTFDVVFATAYSEYAIKAFQVSAVDYLLKPIEIKELKRCVDNFIETKKKNSINSAERFQVFKTNYESSAIQKIALPVAHGFIFVRPEEVLYLKADGAYTNIFLTNGEKYLISKKLKEFEAILNLPIFYKPHRSYLINLNEIIKFSKQDYGTITMSNEDEVSLSRDKKEEFLQLTTNKK